MAWLEVEENSASFLDDSTFSDMCCSVYQQELPSPAFETPAENKEGSPLNLSAIVEVNSRRWTTDED
jgi:hypothetical protein